MIGQYNDGVDRKRMTCASLLKTFPEQINAVDEKRQSAFSQGHGEKSTA